MGLRDFTLPDLTARNARRDPGGIAFVCEGTRLTHAAYAGRVERTAAAFAGLGLGPGDRVAVVSDNSLATVEAFGAAARLGAILVPLNTRLSPEETSAALVDAEPRLILVEPRHAGLVAGAPAGPRRLSLGAAGTDRLDDLLGEAGPAPAHDVESASPCVMIYTAAVAGRPRGAVLSHANLLASATQLALAWGLGPSDVHLGLLPLFHIAGLSLAVAAQLAGGRTVLLPRFEAEAALALLAAEKATFMASFAPILGTLLDKAEEGGCDLGSLRLVTGLEPAATIERLEAACPGARFWSTYGQAELSGLATLAPYCERPGSAGRPNHLVEMRIVDDRDEPVATGEVGDIVVRGPGVFLGYWRQEEDQEATFRNGWHHTGDRGHFDPDGYLWYAGRSPAKELIKTGGENVYPAEVEAVLRQHPAIREAVVIGVPDPVWGEAVKAVCDLRPGAVAPPVEEVTSFVAERIARYKRPRHVVVAALPAGPDGRPDRAAVKAEHGA